MKSSMEFEGSYITHATHNREYKSRVAVNYPPSFESRIIT